MAGNRKQVEDFIIKYIGKIVTGNENTDLYKELFKNMSDKEFQLFMEDLRDGKTTLSIIVPNGNKNIKVNVENNFKLAKELGFDFFQRLKISGSKELPDYTTPNKFLVFKLPIKRASQLLSKKVSIPEDDRSIDILTGQVTGKSRASKLTLPELQLLIGMGMKDSLKELVKIRGGDIGANNATNAMLYKQGKASQKDAEEFSTGVISTKSLKAYFNSMHIRNTL